MQCETRGLNSVGPNVLKYFHLSIRQIANCPCPLWFDLTKHTHGRRNLGTVPTNHKCNWLWTLRPECASSVRPYLLELLLAQCNALKSVCGKHLIDLNWDIITIAQLSGTQSVATILEDSGQEALAKTEWTAARHIIDRSLPRPATNSAHRSPHYWP